MPHAHASGFPSPSFMHVQSNDRGGQTPALRKKTVLHRRARACPSPSFMHAHSNARGGQTPALREKTALHRRARACPSPSSARPFCRSGSPDPDPFAIRRSQTTEGETHIGTMVRAGETRSHARMASEGPRATGSHRDQEVSPTERIEI